MANAPATKVEIVTKRRKSRDHGGHHGGAWKVAYADFVTAMMAFFMVMWLISQNQSTREAIASYFRDPGVFETTSVASVLNANGESREGAGRAGMAADDAIRQELQSAAARIREQLRAAAGLKGLDRQVDLQLTSEGLRIELVDTEQAMFFDMGSAEMKPEATRLFAIIAAELKSLNKPVILEGHTDSRRYTTTQSYSNWELSADRANAARRVMLKAGLSGDLIAGVRGFADRQPRVRENPLDPRNRRVSIVVPVAPDIMTPAVRPGNHL